MRRRGHAIRTLVRQVLVSLLFGLAVAASLELLGRSELFEKTELLTLDFRYRARPAPEFRSDVGYVDFDDTSIARFGRWVWPRNRQVTLVRLLDRYDARALGYDVFFSEKSDVVLDLAKAFEEAGGTARERAAAAFLDHDSAFEQAMREAGSVYLAQYMVQPDSTIAAKGLAGIQEYIANTRPRWPQEKHDALAYSLHYAREADTLTATTLYKAVDVVPPLARFGAACAGIGYAQIVKDLDQTVRLYPLFMYFDGHVFPSIAVVMLSRILQVPMEEIRIEPGRFIEFPDALLFPAAPYPADGGAPAARGGEPETVTIRIPVDRHGQMLVNWGGGFYDRGLHLSFAHIARFAAEDEARLAAAAMPADTTAFARIRVSAARAAGDEELVPEDEAWEIGEAAAWARILDASLRAGSGTAFPDPVEATHRAWAELGAQSEVLDSARVERIARAIVLAERVAGGETGVVDPVLGRAWSEAIVRTVSFWSARGMTESVRPLWIPKPVLVPWDGMSRPFTAVDLEGKILLAGLTGVGTIDLNPMPFDNDCPMVALHTNAVNTILTNRFLRFPADDERRLYLWGLILAASLLCGMLPPAQSFAACAALVGGFSWHVWSSWVHAGRWHHLVEPIFGVAVVYTFEAVISLVRAAREKQKVRGIFSTMVSPKVLKLMEDNPDRFSLTGERKPATIFFSAIDGFGRVTQREDPEELGAILGLYLTPCSELILEYDGYIDKYEGHVIMADFGVPLDDPDHAWKCCFAAIEQQMDIEPFRTYVLARYGTEVRVSMGINSGYVSAGNMGSEKKMQYTVMGDAVNVAARFRPANGIYGTGIITGEATEPLVRDRLELRMLDRLLLKGKTKPTTLYEVMGWKPEAYMALRGERPVPESVLVRWTRCPAHKVYGYRAWWRSIAQTHDSPLAARIADFFESQEPRMEAIVVAGALMSVRSLERDLRELLGHLARIEGGRPSAVLPPGLGGPAWQDTLSSWFASLEDALARIDAFEGTATVPEGVPTIPELRMRAINLAGKVSTLRDNLGRTPKSWVPAVGLSLDAMRGWFEGRDDPHAAATVEEGWARYREDATRFHATIAADPRAWHELMARAGALTPVRSRVRDLYEEALRLHWDRRWEDALNRLAEALAADPQDGPSQALADRIRGYQVNAPGPQWQGEFVQTKK